MLKGVEPTIVIRRASVGLRLLEQLDDFNTHELIDKVEHVVPGTFVKKSVPTVVI